MLQLQDAARMTAKVLALIPARGGSKGLHRKNIALVAGKPLFAWTIEAALKAQCITTALVSSDDDEILQVAREYGAEVIQRPAELATETSRSDAVVLHAVRTKEKMGQYYDYIILLQPTSPLRNSEDINNAYNQIVNADATALISVQVIDNKILKAFKKKEDGFLEGVSHNTYPFICRQDLPETYMSNGAIYIIKKDCFIRNESLLTDKTISFLMNSKKSIDIDCQEDIEIASKLLQMTNLQ